MLTVSPSLCLSDNSAFVTYFKWLMLKGNNKSINYINKVERPEWFQSSDTVTSAIDPPSPHSVSGSPQWRGTRTHTHTDTQTQRESVLGLAKAAQCSAVKRGLNKSCWSSSVTCALAPRPQSNATVQRVPGPLQPSVTVGRSQHNTTGPHVVVSSRSQHNRAPCCSQQSVLT